MALNDTLGNLPAPQYTFVGNAVVYQSEAEYVALMETFPIDSLLPTYTTSYTDAKGPEVVTGLISQGADIYQAGVGGDNNLISLVSFDVAAGANRGPTNSVTLLTSYDATLYAASDNFYLITSRWSYVSDWTFIDQLSLENGGITLSASGAVPGTILNQFAVSENGADLYIATTSGWWDNASNNLYVLTADGNALNVIGKLEGFAPGQSIEAVTFFGDRAFISTYANLDPLFAVDISDPTDPVVAGSLEVSGNIDYLQPIDATHLIGIGQNYDSTTGYVSSFEISLYDVSDINNPVLVSQYEVTPNGGWSWSDAAYDYHAITYYPAFQALALPVSSDTQVTAPDGSTQWIYQTDLLVFHLDPAGGTLSLQGEVGDASAIQRGVFIGNMLYAVSSTSVQAFSLNDLSTQVGVQVKLPDPVYPDWWWWGWGVVPLAIDVTNMDAVNTPVTPATGGGTNDGSTPTPSDASCAPPHPPLTSGP